jgi:hypothetical protein
MPYRGRAVTRVRGQRDFKAPAPLVKFTLTKQYVVNKTAGQSSYSHVIRINASTPFQPISSISGSWNSDSVTNEPLGIDSALYSNYKFLHVHSCHVQASVQDSPDAGNDLENEKLTQGTLSVIRASDSTLSNTESADIKLMYGQKSKDFQLSPRLQTSGGESGLPNNVLTKSAYVNNGYSAKKQFHVPADYNSNLSVNNSAGSTNGPADPTYMFIVVRPQTDNWTTWLLPTTVRIKLTYIIRFSDPTEVQTVPLPIAWNMSSGQKRRKYNKKKSSTQSQISSLKKEIRMLKMSKK